MANIDTMDLTDFLAATTRRKHGNTPCDLDGYHFDSLDEAKRYRELRILEAAGEIRDLQVHPKPGLIVMDKFTTRTGEKVQAIKYLPDFTYVEAGRIVVEDVKALDKRSSKLRTTEAFRIKWKLLKARYPSFEFRIVGM